MRKLNKYLLHSDFIIDYLSGNGQTAHKMTTLLSEDICSSILCFDQIFAAADGINQTEWVGQLLSELPVLEVTEKTVRLSAQLAAKYPRLTAVQRLIAAQCLETGRTLITRDKKLSKVIACAQY